MFDFDLFIHDWELEIYLLAVAIETIVSPVALVLIVSSTETGEF